ncbi:putative prolyl oligopeptidase, putative,serine peptidase clan SC, family S9A [Trypanosoma rangeli]|uniref:Putative prolyl oligopeptidase, putative,serine peptidase clan SC, family S9A n=1 Tax=Trypanosoma rangeli TaxID=5698 RepID=A0A3R7MDK6_TRYRA|nr:putative prolyl oligopeptidase, putative,serine peptidase clan SC, family S9A [Trypanosoma rangeli]RNF03865.1 putative prolyl oligopeptidase, putative,serine peptidase clan SC, family S9A [Trypanosoma rangeli]|eukprot:RNF03865.1 putative prolyl oligopeptidase, putative,serine peptidase clan SC, family S9A [Trypanosoma rangeli]
MSGESIYNLIQETTPVTTGPYTGKYEKHLKARTKPTYSTFFEKGKEYDGSHVRYFKQRDAVFGPTVNDTVDPKNFLHIGGGVKHAAPPVQQSKMFTKPPLDQGVSKLRNRGGKRYLALTSDARADGNGGDELHGPNDLGHDGINGAKTGIPSSNKFGAGSDEKDAGDQESIHVNDRNVPTDFVEDARNGLDDHKEKDLAADGVGVDQLLHSAKEADDIRGKGRREGCKDFVTSNIIQVGNMVPKRRKDQPENLTCRKNFGRAPEYLHRVKQEIDDERMRLKSIEEMRIQQQISNMKRYVHRLDEKERLQLLEKLRTKLNEKSTELIKMPFAKDTYTQVLRRAELEKGIKQIEASIAKLDKDAVFIYSDDPRCVHWTKNAALEEASRFAAERLN